jgi:CBS domain-containing protein
MGEAKVKLLTEVEDRVEFVKHLLDDINALEYMLNNDMYESGVQRIGVEQEFCIVNEDYSPSKKALEILEELDDKDFTTELALYNLELNSKPYQLKGTCFRDLENTIVKKMNKARSVAQSKGIKIVTTGILPTVTYKEINEEFMTPFERYKILGQIIRNARGPDFELHLLGVDELNMKHDCIMIEACNTSFQVHLQIEPKDFVDQYNWASAIAGPVLSVVTNSPIMMGNELWSETRLALFHQSVDLRKTTRMPRNRQPRVSFGNQWIRESVAEIYKDDISRYTLLITSDLDEWSFEEAKKGNIPDLTALRVHNGTIYKWNRPCFGVTNGKAHLRIENRYIPSGPSIKDEIANAMFWIGLMNAMPDKYKNIWEVMDFKEARTNFIKAARFGLETEFEIFDDVLPARRLILENLLPLAASGLRKSGIDEMDIKHYLGVIAKRVEKNQTGSQWTVHNYRTLRKSLSKDESLKLITRKMVEMGDKNIPVSEWKHIEPEIKNKIFHTFETVGQIMSIDLFVVRENDILELVINIMKWRKISRMPVEGLKGDLVGLLTRSRIERLIEEDETIKYKLVKEVMIKNVIVAEPDDDLDESIKRMKRFKVGCLPVVQRNELIGIITETDVINVLEKKGNIDEYNS